MSAGLGSYIEDKEATRFDSYVDKDGGEHRSISDNPFIILSADNSNQIRTLRNTVKEKNIPFTDFTNTMTVGTFATYESMRLSFSQIVRRSTMPAV